MASGEAAVGKLCNQVIPGKIDGGPREAAEDAEVVGGCWILGVGE